MVLADLVVDWLPRPISDQLVVAAPKGETCLTSPF